MYLIKNATVHIGNGTMLQQSDVLVEGKVIKEVGKNLSAEGAEIIDVIRMRSFSGIYRSGFQHWCNGNSRTLSGQ